ncbi:peptidoglycan-binding protein [Virgibacillus halodenitrificans]|uniref:peptidoglycan-binding protein n=1 Tax=Virgibacillus halodenitrificans TaxID=1482 RepID=UPI000760D42F
MKIRRNSIILPAAIFSLFHFSPISIIAAESTEEIEQEVQQSADIDQSEVEGEEKNTGEQTNIVNEDTVASEEETVSSDGEDPQTEAEPSIENENSQGQAEKSTEPKMSNEEDAETHQNKEATEEKTVVFTASSQSFQKGDTHEEIADMKTKLNAIGFDGIKVTNYFGNFTEQRVKEFQKNYGIQVTGIADQVTLAKINDVYTSPFQLGNRHKDIVNLKEKLNKTTFGDILVTNYYGSFTEQRVKEVQRYFGLKDNGIADSLTREKINSLVSKGFQYGDRNKEIINIKNKLNAIGFGQIKVTDYFGSYTKEKVEEFQNYFGLQATGTANAETLEKLDQVYYSPFQEGNRHNETEELKKKLNRLGFGDILVTTYYGAFTATQVKSFQDYYGLKVNGIADEVTRKKMDEILASPLQQGKHHEKMIEIKEKLNRLGYGPITVTTYFGSYTEKQVKEFQRNNDLRVSGILDEVSMKKLNEVFTTGFQNGARHDGIIDLKNKLNRLGFGNILVTTYYGNFTEKKVKEFQDYYGLEVTGIANKETLDKLDEMMNHPLQKGKSHSELPELKHKLNWLGYGEILVTDYFGSYTEKKLKEFQKDYNLPVSGIGDKTTIEKLTEAISKVFQEGSRHPKISQLKNYLDKVGFGGILITDYYGNYTAKRVKEFQEYYELEPTGIADYNTLKLLNSLVDSPFQEGKRNEKTKELKQNLNKLGFKGLDETNLYDSLTKQHVTGFQEYYGLVANGIADGPTFTKIKEVLSTPYQEGKRHEGTIKLKEDLNRIGFGNIQVTSLYGSYTAKRVSDLQTFYGLRVNGIADAPTLSKIDEIISSPMQLGNTHPDISQMKRDLNSLGYDGIKVTDYFGSFTEERLKQFQDDYGLPVSGIADEITLLKLKEALESREVITYSQFDISLEAALDVQMNQLQQTDKYRNDPAYIHSNYVEIIESAIINGNGVRLRTSPNFNDNIATTVNTGTKVTIRETVTGASYSGSTRWYEIGYNDKVLFVHSSLVDLNGKIAITTAKVNIRSKASNSSHIYDTIPAGTSVNILEEGTTWHKISYQTWRNPTRTDVMNYLDPNNNDVFQHLQLSKSAGVSAAELNRVLSGKGILDGKGQALLMVVSNMLLMKFI